ncbi:hypothetical protein SAMN05216298_5051 [Glycomyces sambucus]|uniref:Uncharacterized protein n=1 Tax=Glycomyces sambucus TaxID=380244 RepID=A0A1G9MN66_9ACTN|nr:hypothetical protein SAMN05216298_5051 [Glycomyces sambucus]
MRGVESGIVIQTIAEFFFVEKHPDERKLQVTASGPSLPVGPAPRPAQDASTRTSPTNRSGALKCGYAPSVPYTAHAAPGTRAASHAA